MKLAQFIKKQWGINVNPSSMFDVQVLFFTSVVY